MVFVGIRVLIAVNSSSASPLLAQEKPDDYQIFVDKIDGYLYFYPSDWREFELLGHDSSFKDIFLQLQNVVGNLTSNIYSASNQFATILGMQEKNIDSRSYYTFEYILTYPNFSRADFATIAIGTILYIDCWRKRKTMKKSSEPT